MRGLWDLFFGPAEINPGHIVQCSNDIELIEKDIKRLEDDLRLGIRDTDGITYKFKPGDPKIFEKLMQAKTVVRLLKRELSKYTAEQIEDAKAHVNKVK